MLIKVASVAAMVAIIGILAMTVPTTIQLSRLDSGLSQSLASTGKLVAVEKAVVSKNKSLGTLVTTAGDMEKNLQTTQTVTSVLNQNIASINQLNQETLSINQSIAKKSSASAQNLHQIATSMQTLGQATSSLAQTLSQLSAVVAKDAQALQEMKRATDQINAKVPGVSG